ncbi:hypothetical protein ACF08M_28215 [Streptomyces sp. NPDC015032]|uniref:hypothetical protein n=1 Tax=Streptomyces sp. NPDC015032 TaxID=3364937 RepID=UPI0037000567
MARPSGSSWRSPPDRDRALSSAGLLQAVARTNRPYRGKRWGQVVDFIGIGPELARSLGEYEKAHLRELYGYDTSVARRRYLDGGDDFSPRRYGAKIRQVMARHLKVSGIEQRIPPVDLTAADFMERVNANSDPRARVSYMTGSVKVRIVAEIGSDRARYTRFSRRLDEILQEMRDDFEQAAAELTQLVGDMNTNEAEGAGAGSGLDPLTERPVHGLLVQELEEDALTPPGADLIAAARALTVEIAGHVRSPDIVHLTDTRDRVRKQLRVSLETHVSLDWEDTGPLAGLLVELAVERRDGLPAVRGAKRALSEGRPRETVLSDGRNAP